jgi:hypothetical protein
MAEASPATELTAYKKRRAAGEVELTPRHRLLAEYLTLGTSHARAKRLGFPIDQPLTLEQAAAVLDLRRRNARQVTRTPEFQRLMAQMVGELKSGAKAKAVHALIEVVGDKGENTAADRAVRIKAANAILDDGDGKGGFNVTINNQVNSEVTKAGYVIRLPADVGRPEPVAPPSTPARFVPAPPPFRAEPPLVELEAEPEPEAVFRPLPRF